MKLSNRGEYACLAMIDLAVHYGAGLRTIGEIAERRAIPRKFLEQILISLRNAGFVASRMGPHGGYELSRPPSQISVADIIRVTDGMLAPVASVSRFHYAPTPVEASPKLLARLRSIREYTERLLEGTSLADLID